MGKRFSAASIKKVALREEIMEKSKNMDGMSIRRSSSAIADAVMELVEAKRPRESVAIYYPINGELTMDELGERLQAEGCTLALPRVKTKNAPLVFNTWNFCEPKDLDLQSIPCSNGQEIKPDIVIVPMVGYDKNGHRIGYGNGYYDRTFEKLDAYKIGVAFSFQEVDPIEAEAHDIAMDAIVTENGIVFRA
jgi:5-formyltetrahydrofolate cyclo-ligase